MRDWIKRNKVKSLILASIILAILLIVVSIILFMKSSPGFNYWVWDDHGSVADWLGGALTIAAIIVGFKQLKIQNQLDRAKTMENKRPRFDVKSAAGINTNVEMDVLMIQHDSTNVTSILKDVNKYKIQIINISENPVYNLDIKFTYIDENREQQIDTFSYSGLMPGKHLIIIPEDCDNSIKMEKLIMKFISSSGELGFCQYEGSERIEEDFEHAKYYFVTGNNEYVSGSELGRMISKENQQFKELDFEPDYLNNRYVYHGNTSKS